MSTTKPTPIPIACTLTSGDYATRLAWIADLNRTALRSHRRTGLALELVYAREAADRVRELVRNEEECCAFLRFTVRDEHDTICLTIVAPDEARDALDAIFSPFLPQPNGEAESPCAETGCGCGSKVPAAAVKDDDRAPSRRAPSLAAASAATAALACGICCVLPFALPAVAVATFGGVIGFFGRVYWWALWLAVAAVAAGWAWIAVQIMRSRRRPARATLRGMAVATAILALAAAWSFAEPTILRALRT